MKVLKFGGTSVGTPESLNCVKSIVENQPEPLIVTVSALGGITNRLIECGNRAEDAAPVYHDIISQIRQRHFDVIKAVVAPDCQA
ncbi:MAG: bifunctional aspartate kinase/homoserine dehydrogenase I, partial [Muribaculaceae bacterium]|nr:bifunctional aspartate kinase/homoserine dehydrogenase I [Muribaculaceae bacterium]